MPTHVTITGRATGDPELRFTPSGKPVCNLNVAVNHRKRTPTGDWEDDGADFYRINAWDRLAENIAETITKGMDVIIVGTLRSREWETRDGDKRTSWEINADNIGPSIRYATARVTKTNTTQQQPAQTGWEQPARTTSQQAPTARPQAAQQPADPYQGQSLSTYEEPPF